MPGPIYSCTMYNKLPTYFVMLFTCSESAPKFLPMYVIPVLADSVTCNMILVFRYQYSKTTCAGETNCSWFKLSRSWCQGHSHNN